MLRIFIISLGASASWGGPPITTPKLFSHQSHQAAFRSLSMSCLSCHDFSRPHTGEKGPLAPLAEKPTLKPMAKICHECHFQKVAVPTPSRCQTCHTSTAALVPDSHSRQGAQWMQIHGSRALFDRDSCLECHSEGSCSDCHIRRNMMKPMVHRPGFRFMHSFEASMSTQSCTSCHQTAAFCVDCHKGKRQ